MSRPRWNLPPVEVSPERPERLSVTMLERFQLCPRSAYLGLLHGQAPGHHLARGSLFHLFQERALWTLLETGEASFAGGDDPGQVAALTAAIVDEVLAERPDLVVPRAEKDDVREMAYHSALGYDVTPDRVVEIERRFMLELEGWTVVGKVDVLAADGAEVLQVDDFKTSFAVPAQEEFERSFQTPAYAALVAFGRPVEKDPCTLCRGATVLRCTACGSRDEYPGCHPGEVVCTGCEQRTVHAEDECRECKGRGYVDRLGDPIGDRTNFFRVRELYPRYLDDMGGGERRLRERRMVLTRTELHDWLEDLRGYVRQFSVALESGRWEAVPGEGHCWKCPAQSECPLPGALRGHAGSIETREQAEEALTLVERQAAEHKAIKAEVRNWAKRGGPVRVGRDLVYEWAAESKTETDYDGLAAGVSAAVEYGEPFDIARFRRRRTSTSFRRRRVKPGELDGQEAA